MASIYALFSGRDGVVRYVGKTTYACDTRFKAHVRDSWQSRGLYKWFRNEWRQGYPIEWERLQWCKASEADDLETKWIAKFPNLFNERKLSWHTPSRAPVIPEIKAHMRRYMFNASGFHGITYDRHNDLYCVQIFSGSEIYWLPGDDDVPGWGPSRWFNDLATAVDARERWRKIAPHRSIWLPDRELMAA